MTIAILDPDGDVAPLRIPARRLAGRRWVKTCPTCRAEAQARALCRTCHGDGYVEVQLSAEEWRALAARPTVEVGELLYMTREDARGGGR